MPFKRILLVKPSGRHGLSFAFDIIPTGLEYIASYIEKDVDEVRIIDLEMEPKPIQTALIKHLAEFKPDLVGISMSATEHTEGLEIAKISKERGIPTVLGGYHPSAIPDELLGFPHVDMIVRVEGEETMLELVRKGSPEGIAGISYKDGGKIVRNPDREFIKDLDSIPFPARHLRRYKYHLTLAKGRDHDVITTSRGCWGQCSFCCEPTMSHSSQRYRTPENVIEEILEISKYHGGKPMSLEITDPHFMGKPKLVEKFCDLLKPLGLDIEFIAKVRPDSMARHPEIVKKMIDVGVVGFEMGIESPNMKDLKSTSKGLKNDTHIMAVKSILDAGGVAGGSFVIGLEDHTEEEILYFPEYAKELGLLSSAFAVATPFPDTGFYDELNSRGLIFETRWDVFDEMHSVFKCKHLTSTRIHELASICMVRFWTLDTFLEKERMEMKRRGSKLRLVDFILDKMTYLTFGVGAGFQVHGAELRTHIVEVFNAAVDPNAKKYTTRTGVQDIIDMSRFLEIVGKQTLQITMWDKGVPLSSWVVKTNKDAVEYVDVVAGKRKGATIDFNPAIDDFHFGEDRPRTIIDPIRIICKFLLSNKGFRRKLAMVRLLAAIGSESLHYFSNRKKK